MALLVWCPLTKDLHNQGLYNISTASGTQSTSGGKLGSGYYSNISISNLPTATDFTICFWFYNSGSMRGNIPVIQDGSATTLSWGTNDYTSSGSGHAIKMSHTNNGPHWTYDTVTDSTGWLLDHWDHYTVIHKNGSSTTVQVYINGILKGDSTTAHNITLNSGTLTISNARINDFRLYDHCLTATEVKEVSKALIGGWLGNDIGSHINLTKGSYDYNSSTRGTGNFRIYPNVGSVDNTAFYGTPAWHTYRTGLTTTSWSEFLISSYSGSFTPGATYTLSYYYKIGTNSSTYSSPSIGGFRYWKAGDSTMYTSGWTTVKAVDFTETGKWKLAIYTFVAPSDCTNWLYLFITVLYNCDYYIARIKVEEGNFNTLWVPDGINTYGVCPDALSGLHNDLTVNGSGISLNTDTKRYDRSILLGLGNTNTSTGLNYLKAYTGLTSPTALTLSFWYKGVDSIYSSSGYNGIISLSALSDNPGDYTTGGLNQYDTMFRVNNNSGSNATLSSNGVVITGEWVHLVVVYNGNTAILYKNGTAVKSGSLSGLLGSCAYLYVGWSYAGGVYRNPKGYYSDIRLYATALSADDIQALYKLGN